MMSMSEHAVTGEAPRVWQRWQPAPLPEHHSEKSQEPGACSPRDTCRLLVDVDADHAERSSLHEAARQQGYAQGYQEGYAQGLKEGAQAGRLAGHSAGYEAGNAEGRSDGQALAQQEARRLQYLANACAEALYTLEADLSHQLVELALHIAQKVLQSSLAAHPGHITDLVGQLLRLNTDDQAVLALRIHPDDEAVLRPYLECAHSARRWRIVPQPTLERGDCIAETVAGSIDATLATRWQRVISSLGHTLPWMTQADHAER